MSRKIEIENRIHNLKSQVIDLKYRATGRTTRIVDEYIQKIYENKGEWVEIADHHYSMKANKMVADKVTARLKYEHSSDEFKYRRVKGFEIMLVSCARDGVVDDMRRINKEIAELERQLKEMED